MTESQLAPVFADGFEVEIDVEHNFGLVSFAGVVHLKELVDSYSSFIRHPQFKKNMNCCYDFANALVEINLNETEIFYHFTAGLKEKRGDGYKLAFVYGDEMTKMLSQFYRLFLSRTQIELQLYDHSDEAISWLKEDF